MKTHLNLLPIEFRRRMLLRHRLLQWSGILIVVTVGLAGVYFVESSRRDRARSRLAALASRAQPFEKERLEMEAMRRRLANLNTRESLLSQLDSSRQTLQIIGLISRSAGLCDGGVQVKNLALSERRESVADESAKLMTRKNRQEAQDATKTVAVTSLTLTGEARDDLTVTRFVTGLRDGNLFQHVKLNSTTGTGGDGLGKQYNITCTNRSEQR